MGRKKKKPAGSTNENDPIVDDWSDEPEESEASEAPTVEKPVKVEKPNKAKAVGAPNRIPGKLRKFQ